MSNPRGKPANRNRRTMVKSERSTDVFLSNTSTTMQIQGERTRLEYVWPRSGSDKDAQNWHATHMLQKPEENHIGHGKAPRLAARKPTLYWPICEASACSIEKEIHHLHRTVVGFGQALVRLHQFVTGGVGRNSSPVMILIDFYNSTFECTLHAVQLFGVEKRENFGCRSDAFSDL